ncbi:MAG: asparagine synthase-related protein [Bacteroidales bacterium]
MSAIFGYINFSGKPLTNGKLQEMKSAMDFWGPDDQAIWQEGCAGMGYLLLYNTPEAVHEKQPLTTADGNEILFFAGRVDNRDDLCRQLSIPATERDKHPDSYYVLGSYEKWGEDCPDKILGDWSFVVWNKQTQRLFLARDHHGITAMYYYKGHDFFVFSSSLKGILTLPEVPKKINEYKIAQILVAWNDGGPETSYQDILRLPPAHTLTLDNGNVKTNRYWYLENTPELKLGSEQEYIDAFMEIYREAVRCRLRSYRPVGATLSGGLDSGSVCALAAPMLAERGESLKAFCAVPMYDITGLVPPNRIGDEGPLAQATADFVGNIDLTLCKSENISPLEGIERMLEIQDEPIHAAGNAYWIINIAQRAKDMGLGTVLIGQGGNSTISWKYRNSKNGNSWVSVFVKYVFMNFINVLDNNNIRKLLISKLTNDFLLYGDSFLDINLTDCLWNKRLFQLQLKRNRIKSRYLNILNGVLGNWYEIGLKFRFVFRDPTVDHKLLLFLASVDNEYVKSNLFYNYLIKTLQLNGIYSYQRRGLQSADLKKRVCSSSDIDKSIYKNINILNKIRNNKELLISLRYISLLSFLNQIYYGKKCCERIVEGSKIIYSRYK